MTTATTARQITQLYTRWWMLAVGVLVCLGGLARVYRYSAQPLWLDELFTAQLAQSGPARIWANAFADHTLPLPNLIFWLATMVGGVSVASVRFVSVAAACLALLLFAIFAGQAAGRLVALVATGLLAIAPLAVYYAQEARPYALPLLGQMVTLLAYLRLLDRRGWRDWAVYIATSVVAAQLHYVNIPIIGGQLLAFLVLVPERRGIVFGGAATVAFVVLSMLPFLAGANAEMANWQGRPDKLQLFSTLQTMLVGDTRIASPFSRQIAVAVVAAGCTLALFARPYWRAMLAPALQVGLLCFTAFVLLPSTGRGVPAFDERIFLAALPGTLFCFACGIAWLGTRQFGWIGAALLCAGLLFVMAQSLVTFFGPFSKSPEGQLAAAIIQHLEPGDHVICGGRAYSIDAALRFQQPTLPVATHRGERDGISVFAIDMTLIQSRMPQEQRLPLANLLQSRRLWFADRVDGKPPYRAELFARYRPSGETYTYGPFTAQLLIRMDDGS